MSKKTPKEAPLIDAQDSNIIASLNNKITTLEKELNKLREKELAEQSKGINDNPEYMTAMKELRRLRGI
jgi:hypothetical protein